MKLHARDGRRQAKQGDDHDDSILLLLARFPAVAAPG